MTKLEVGKEYWFKGKITHYDKTDEIQPFEVEIDNWYGWISAEAEAVEVIPGREKVTIPKEVAEWLEMCKDDGDLGLSYALSSDDMSDDVYRWLLGQESFELDNCNQDTFARAWLDGYEIEKEPLYTVEIPDPYSAFYRTVLYRNNNGNVVIVRLSFNDWEKLDDYKLTEEEIKQNHEWAWQWAEPAEEE